MVKEVIIAFGVANPAIYIASLGLPGLWFIFVSVLAISNKSIPKLLVFLGLCGVGEYCNGVCSCGGDYLADLFGAFGAPWHPFGVFGKGYICYDYLVTMK